MSIGLVHIHPGLLKFKILQESGEEGLDSVKSLAVVYGDSDNPYTKSSALHVRIVSKLHNLQY